MNLLQLMRFRYLIALNRYSEALTLSDPADARMRSDRVWAYYRLCAYRSAREAFRQPQSSREALATAISLAACGDVELGCKVLLDAHQTGLLKPALWLEAIRAIAPYSIETALVMAEGMARMKPGYYAAMLAAAGRHAEAAELVGAALAQGKKDPDLFLLKANESRDMGEILLQTNRFLSANGLSAARLRDEAVPPSAGNFLGTVAAGTVRGPLVTITMPSFNTASRIAPAIESLLAQTYRDIEVLVVDDASTDGSVAVVKAIAEKDSRVRILVRDQNGGPYAARNMAVSQARGEFVTCHDSDDWAHPEKIARQVAPLLRDQRLVFTLCNWVRITDDGAFYSHNIYPLTRLNPASPLFRKDLVAQRAGYYEDVRTGADTEFIARLKLVFGRSAWKRFKEPLAIGAHRPGSLMTDAKTGVARGRGMNPDRLAYWEAWTRRHLERRIWEKAVDVASFYPLPDHHRWTD